ncbi:hypothetical protein BCV72DRAFT_211623 [Rhizopus microsporus var. microsporus]|uniref:Uncharacterized protein n=1 Tax=Rhizopus microsporus var. microsporus TaxID=86635 RepID=A0A1X0QWY0_RHIZD|nr:hypothetical protein BCV72DRAFT_211623 [Rhizopus microsporus var. microsporus]
MSEVKLVGNRPYVASHLGSLRLPSTQMDLGNLRTLLERLFTLKYTILIQESYYVLIEHKKQATKRSMESKQNVEIPPYSLSSTNKYTLWVRGAWFPPSTKKDRRYQDEWSPSLFSHSE